MDHSFYGFTGVITNVGCWENTRKACKPRAEGTRGLSPWTGALKGNFNSLIHFLVLSLPWMLLMSGRFSYVFSSFTRYSNSDYCDRPSHSCIHLHLNSRSCGYLFCQRNAFPKTESQVSSHQVRTNTTVGDKLLFILNNLARGDWIQFWNRILFWKHLRINHGPKILVLVVVVKKYYDTCLSTAMEVTL